MHAYGAFSWLMTDVGGADPGQAVLSCPEKAGWARIEVPGSSEQCSSKPGSSQQRSSMPGSSQQRSSKPGSSQQLSSKASTPVTTPGSCPDYDQDIEVDINPLLSKLPLVMVFTTAM